MQEITVGSSVIIQVAMESGNLFGGYTVMNTNRWLKHIRKNDPCAYCGNKESGTIDHIVPTNLGGDNGFQNMAPCCNDCNNKKGSIKLLPFLMFRKFLYGED